jgi:hypothetical protein
LGVPASTPVMTRSIPAGGGGALTVTGAVAEPTSPAVSVTVTRTV